MSGVHLKYLAVQDAIERRKRRDWELQRIAAEVESRRMVPAVAEVLIAVAVKTA